MGCSTGTTAASAQALWLTRADSTSAVPILCPLTLITSSTRPASYYSPCVTGTWHGRSLFVISALHSKARNEIAWQWFGKNSSQKWNQTEMLSLSQVPETLSSERGQHSHVAMQAKLQAIFAM